MRTHFTITGKTEDGRLVAGNVFPFVDRLGIPLAIVYDELKKNDVVPDWYGFICDALEAKWNPNTLKSRILDALLEKEEKQRFLYFWTVLFE